MSREYDVPKVKSKVQKRHDEKYGDEVDGDEIVTVAYFEDQIEMKSGKFYYGVQLVTGKQYGAGSKFCTNYIELVGDKGRTGQLSFHGMRKFLERDTFTNLTVVADAELGKVLVVVVGCGFEFLYDDSWYVSFVMVVNLQLQVVDQFPCYSWISRNKCVTITANTTTMKEVAGNKILLQQRKEQILKRQNVYNWQKDKRGIPSSIDDSSFFLPNIPADQQFGDVKNIDFICEGVQDLIGSNFIERFFVNCKDVQGYEVLAKHLGEGGKRPLYEDGRWTPSSIDDTSFFLPNIPADQQFGDVKNIDFICEGVQDLIGSNFIERFFVNCKDVQGYEVLAKHLGEGGKRPLYEDGRWTSDEEFGYQMLNGVNPIVIEKCEKLPHNFPVTNEMVGPFLSLSLEEEMKAGHIYMCNMKILDGLPTRKSYFNVAPICLLYVNKSKKLVPIAIQLKQGVSEEDKKTGNPIFLPSDNRIDWILAKMFYQSAHSQYHETFTHYTACHATMEAFSMGTQRNLPNSHPIFKLLIPSFLYTMAINSRARAALINPGGIIDGFFGIGGKGLTMMWKRCGATYNVHTSNIKRWAKERGVDNAEQLPGYYYRDDGIKVWDALEKYTGDIIDQYYETDEDVANDEELQAWAHDLHTNGFPEFDGAEGIKGVPVGHGFPDKMTSKEELTMYCTLIMFTGSAQHASVNFMQYHYYQFVPNAPFGVRRPPPANKGVADYQYFLDSLPDKESAINTIGTVHLLSQYGQKEKFLGDFHLHLFTEKKSTASQETFKDALKRISGEIKDRNEKLPIDTKYCAMLPTKIPNSITI